MPGKSNQATQAPVLHSRQVENREAALTYRWMRVIDAIASRAGDNPKLHDIGALALSILESGFIDSPKWDERLNGGQGGIVYGNGRLEALALLEQMHRTGQPLLGPGGQEHSTFKPAGVATEAGTGAWVIQVAFGVEVGSSAQAQRLLIDHNNLTLAGGGFTALDMSRLYDREAYLGILQNLEGELGAAGDGRLLEGGSIALTVDSDDLALLMKVADQDASEDLDLSEGDTLAKADNDEAGRPGQGSGQDSGQDSGQEDIWQQGSEGTLAPAMLKLKYSPEQFAEVTALITRLSRDLEATNPADCVLKALRRLEALAQVPVEA